MSLIPRLIPLLLAIKFFVIRLDYKCIYRYFSCRELLRIRDNDYVDSKNYFASNNLTIAADGSEKINSSASDNLVLTANGQAITLVYANATVGWIYKTNSAS